MPDKVREEIAAKLKQTPQRPGVYLLKDSREKVLYVGKAKSLRSRLSSYFQKAARLEPRKQSMVKSVRDFSFVVTDNELEALALEANMIKQYRPKYNVILRDDKNYPYLKLSLNEPWPRLEVVRRTKKDGAVYFGPYVSSSSMYEALEFVNRNFGLRPCRYRLDRPMRPCIQHQMGRCPAPCAGLIGREEYLKAADEVTLFLRGKDKQLVKELEGRMHTLSGEMRYEEAAAVRDRIVALKRAWESQKVVAPELGDVDVVGLARQGAEAAIRVLFIRSGTMIGAKDFFLKDLLGVPDSELMSGFALMFYSKDIVPPAEVLMPVMPDDAEELEQWIGREAGHRVEIKVPQRGKRHELVKMAADNALVVLEGRRSLGIESVVEELRERLGLTYAPSTIGAFDVSNFSGSDPVGAFIFWRDGEFDKSMYRHIRIRSVEGIDDYAMMRETVARVLGAEGFDIPDLVIIDGGRGHLESALESVRSIGLEPMPYMIGVAKKPDRAIDYYSAEPVDLEDRAPSSLLLKRLRDEVHRFAVGYHTNLRGRRLLDSPIEGVHGIGKKRRLELLKHFGSLENIRKATVEELAAAPGMNAKVALALREHLDALG